MDKENKRNTKLTISYRTKFNVAGVTYGCALGRRHRQDILYCCSSKDELYLKEYEYKRKPAYYIVLQKNNMDIGCVPASLVNTIKKYDGYDYEIAFNKIDHFFSEDRDEEVWYAKVEFLVYKEQKQVHLQITNEEKQEGIYMKNSKKSDWILWVLLVLLAPIGIAYMWLAKKEFTVKKKKILSIVFGIWFAIVLIVGNSETKNDESTEIVKTETTEEPISEPTEEVAKETEPTPEPMPTYDIKEIKKLYSSDDVIGQSTKNIDEVENDILLSKTVNNDAKGNFRLARIAYYGSLEEYAMSYYEKYFSSDDEVHYIVNFTTKTTTCIANMGSFLSVTVTEYVDKEEHDAATLGCGFGYGQFNIYFGTNDIEQIK